MARTVQEIMADLNNQVAQKRWEEQHRQQENVRKRRADALAAGRVPRGRPRKHPERDPVVTVITEAMRRDAGRRVYCPRHREMVGRAQVSHIWVDGVCACGHQQCGKITGHGTKCQVPAPCPYHG